MLFDITATISKIFPLTYTVLFMKSVMIILIAISVFVGPITAQTNQVDRQYQTTLRCHDVLNQTLWDGEILKPEVRAALLAFADAWKAELKIPSDAILDVVFVGGNANYNYAAQSDIDVHLLVNVSKISCDASLFADFVAAKQKLWVRTHKIKVMGYDVEPYAQEPFREYTPQKGVFSLRSNQWLQRPNRADCITGNSDAVRDGVLAYARQIESLVISPDGVTELGKLLAKLKSERDASIHQGEGEFSLANLIYKELRNGGYIDKIEARLLQMHDESLSFTR